MPVTIKLSKSDSSVPWGFRLHGGKDFGAPLTVQRINPGSIAARCGLEIGDNISAIDSCPTTGLKHKEAQDLIVKAGNNIQLSVCRGDEIPVRQLDVSENFTTGTFRSGESTLNSDSSLASQVESLSIGDTYKNRLPSYSSGPASYKAPPAPTISSKNAALYQPSFQTITSGLTKSVEDPNQDYFDDFPPPPPSLPPPSPSNFSAVSSGRPHQPVQRFPDFAVAEETSSSTKNLEPGKYVPSETYRLVKDLEAGVNVPFNPRTGAGVKSSPIQSKLVDILEKKHATLETDRMQDNQVKRSTSPQPSYYGPKNSNYGVTIGGAARNRDVQKTQKPVEPNNRMNPEPPSFARAPSPQPASKTSILEKLDPTAVPICNVCNVPVRGAYIMAINKIFCPEHFVCSQPGCKVNLSDVGFVEEQGQVYCKDDYERYFAPKCAKCDRGIIGNTVKALKCTYHPECFTCAQCNQAIMGGSFHLHEGQIYCDKDFSVLFSAKCLGCNFPIEVGDNWIEAVGTNWHGECFNCFVCQVNLQNSGFVHKNGRFLCRDHAR